MSSMKIPQWMLVMTICWLLVWLLIPAIGWCGAKPYYHLTVKASFDPHDPEPGEYAWVTLVEVPKSRAFPEEAAAAARMGGRLRGSVLAFVRGTAWRSSYRYTKKAICHGHHAEMEIFWEESTSESVFAGGGLDDPHHPDRISIHITPGRIFREHGGWFDPRSEAHAFVGPISTGRETAEEMKGNFVVRCINFEDPLTHYRLCGRAWVEQYHPALCHFQHDALRVEFSEDRMFGYFHYGHRDEKMIHWYVIRSSSRQHPYWQRRDMW